MKRRLFTSIATAFALATVTMPLGSLGATPAPYTPQNIHAPQIPLGYHIAAIIAIQERIVQLEDESCWKVPATEFQTLLGWRTGDFLVISPSWYSDYRYCITNQATRTYVHADLFTGPRHTSEFAHHISGMDQNTPGKKSIFLDGKTAWAIASSDHHIVEDWAINDTIIIGAYDGWFYNTTLINVETNTCARANNF